MLHLARENPTRGYRSVPGELLVPGIKVAASTVWQILREAGIHPAPERGSSTWVGFLRSQVEALPACDFFETVTPTGAWLYVFAMIEHASRRIRVLGVTRTPDGHLRSWTARAGFQLAGARMDLASRATPANTGSQP